MPLLQQSRGAQRRAPRVGPLLLAAAAWTAGGAWFARPLRAQAGTAAGAGATSGPVAGVVAGAVRDSTSGRPIAGAAVLLRDSLDHTVGQAVTDERGQYRLAGSAAARRLRVLRLGFRPADVTLASGGPAPREVALVAVPALLAPVRVRAAARCPRGTNSAAALGLLEQVRAGLLATVIAGTQQPQDLTVLSYQREYAPEDPEQEASGHVAGDAPIVRQTVRARTSGATSAPFGASRTGAEFVADGFRYDSAGHSRYFAPDAETLVDDGFAAGYCFRVVNSDHASEVGLGFAAPREREGRVDVNGVLWVDTVARSLRELTFGYVGLSPNVTALRPGGHLSFREMPTGVAFIDRWALRLVSGEDEAGGDPRGQSRGGSDAYGSPDFGVRAREPRLAAQEVGGELARVTWPDGRAWGAPLGAWRMHLTDAAGRPAAGAAVRLERTNYSGVADSAGVVAFSELLPGPYAAWVVDPRLVALGRGKPVEQRVVVARDSTLDTRLAIEVAERVVAAQSPAPAPAAAAAKARAARDTSSVAVGDGRSIERLFTGRFAGVIVTQAADGGLQISMRGTTSARNEEEPLYVLDGTPLPRGTGGIVHLNPYDIDKIEVLKNAEDIGVYGSRGGNGVIRITTTRPGRRQ